MKGIILASGNEHKLKELKSILSDYEILSLKDIGFDEDIIESGGTFAENALIKARVVHKLTGKSVIADDSGLCVDYLGGEPGIYSARFAGIHGDDEKNNEKLLKLLYHVPENQRKAKFVSAAAVVFEDGGEEVAIGEVAGTIAASPKGSNGFGYDPLFIPDGMNSTYAELTDDEKNSVSHRRRAFEKLKELIRSKTGGAE